MTLPTRSQLGRIAAVAAIAVTAFIVGSVRGDRGESTDDDHRAESHADEHAGSSARATVWTCSMHPQIRLPSPGQCPICGMDLIPVEDSSGDDGDWSIEMSESARKLAQIETTTVERLHVTQEVRMVGKVEYDETRLKTVSARFGGRLDRLFVDYTGVPVKKGEHLVWLYSPDLFSAQEELLEALKRVATGARERSEFLRESNIRALDSAREKLRLWGLGAAQIREIEDRGAAEAHIMITSPVGGIVADKFVKEGDYIQTGTRIYTVADLEHVWVKLDAYESNLMWLRYGQEVLIEAEAYPGEVFTGSITFIDPVLEEKTRTVKVRVNVANLDHRLKPGMFVRGVVHSGLARSGKVIDAALFGKWIGPMHPEIVRDGPGSCPICGMPLVPAEKLGFVDPAEPQSAPLVVPVSAVLRTGKRAIAYVQRPGTERPTFDGRVITLGPRAGDDVIVYAGLAEGERVVTNGNFKIDSALQIRARPSMMAPPDEGPTVPATRPSTRPATRPAAPGPTISPAGHALTAVYEGYFAVQEALAGDDAVAAAGAIGRLVAAIATVDATVLEPDVGSLFVEQTRRVRTAARDVGGATDIDRLRVAFAPISDAILTLERELGHSSSATHFEAFCPMPFDGAGGRWMQRGDEVRNPYYGASMLYCGTIEERHVGRGVNDGER